MHGFVERKLYAVVVLAVKMKYCLFASIFSVLFSKITISNEQTVSYF